MTRWSLNPRISEAEKKKLIDVYERHSINISARVLSLIRADVATLEAKDFKYRDSEQ